MKKQYNAPATEVINLQATHMLCGSPIPGGGDGNGQEAEAIAKDTDFAWSNEE